MQPANRRQIWEALVIPPARLDAAESAADDHTTSLVDYFVNCNPWPSWSYIISALYKEGQMDALEKARQAYLFPRDSNKGKCTYRID